MGSIGGMLNPIGKMPKTQSKMYRFNGFNGNCIGFNGNYNGVYWYVMDLYWWDVKSYWTKCLKHIRKLFCNGLTGKS